MNDYIRDFSENEIFTFEMVNSSDVNKFLNKNKNFTIFHTNIRSIQKNFGQLEVTLDEFESVFDIIVLSETWRIGNDDLFNIKDYTKIYNNGNINQNDGVMVYTGC